MQIKPVNYNFSLTNHSRLHSQNIFRQNYTKSVSKDTFECISFGKKEKSDTEFELNLSEKELDKRLEKDYFKTIKMLTFQDSQYQDLDEGDKEALMHLVKAAQYGDEIFYQQDNKYNKAFLEYLNRESEKGNTAAMKTKILFDGQKGIIGVDNKANEVKLAKGIKEPKGKGFYPYDLEADEFRKILKNMLKSNQAEEVRRILSQRTMVVRDSNQLKAVDYTEAFKYEFNKIADELELAAKTSTNKDFNEYLILQAKALRENNPMLDAQADKKWASLEDTPLEFTIAREQYADELTDSVFEDKELKHMLEENNIKPVSKDSIGIRVGIVNKEGTENILRIKKYLPLLAKNMPLNELYEQNISSSNNLQTMADADIVTLTGDEGSYRGGITIAQNLPNNDKPSLQIGGGKRNVYHRQVRKSGIKNGNMKDNLHKILNPELHKYYNNEASHWITIGHENAHSLGPVKGKSALGKYKNIIEESKADMGSIAFLDILTQEGVYTEEEKNQMLTVFALDCFLKAKPNLSQAHRVRSVMQSYYFMKEGAVSVDKNGVIDINLDKMIPTANKMLTDLIKIQLSQNPEAAEKFVNENFQWTNDIENVAKNLREINKVLNGTIETPLADYLLQI